MVNTFTQSGLFGALLQDAQTAECFDRARFLGHMIAFERAYTVALGETGVADDTATRAALGAIDAYAADPQALAAGSDKDGLPVPVFVKALRAGLDDDAAQAIHSGATSQDVLDSAMMLTLRDVLDVFERRLGWIIERLDVLQGYFGARQMMGRTRMQAALPITVADRLRIWQAPLNACLSDLDARRAELVVQLGGAVGLRDMAQGDAIMSILGRELGLPVGAAVWHAERGRVVDVGHWLVRVAGALGKMGQDIALMAQQGIEDVSISGAGGSSAMPHKQNPVAAELLVALARYVAGQQGILAQALVHEQERSGQAWALEWLTLPAMVEATGAALNRAEDLLGAVDRLGAGA